MFDDDGRHVGTIVTREPEWDDVQRDRMEALTAYEAGVCSGCGWHHSLTEDLSNVFTFDTKVCNTCQGAARFERIQSDGDRKVAERMGENRPAGAPLPSDGRKTYLRMMATDEVDELRARRASRSPAPAPQEPKR